MLMKTNGAHTELISTGPKLVQIFQVNCAPISCFARSNGGRFNWLMAL